MNNRLTRPRFAFLHVAALALALIGATAYADPAPPAPAGTPPPATAPAAPAPTATNPAPVTPPAPIAPAPGATVPEPLARREETEGQEQPPAPGATQTIGRFDRALAFMQTKDGLAAKIAALESE